MCNFPVIWITVNKHKFLWKIYIISSDLYLILPILTTSSELLSVLNKMPLVASDRNHTWLGFMWVWIERNWHQGKVGLDHHSSISFSLLITALELSNLSYSWVSSTQQESWLCVPICLGRIPPILAWFWTILGKQSAWLCLARSQTHTLDQ